MGVGAAEDRGGKFVARFGDRIAMEVISLHLNSGVCLTNEKSEMNKWGDDKKNNGD